VIKTNEQKVKHVQNELLSLELPKIDSFSQPRQTNESQLSKQGSGMAMIKPPSFSKINSDRGSENIDTELLDYQEEILEELKENFPSLILDLEELLPHKRGTSLAKKKKEHKTITPLLS